MAIEPGQPPGAGDPRWVPVVPAHPAERIVATPRCPWGAGAGVGAGAWVGARCIPGVPSISSLLPAAQRPASLDFPCPTAPTASADSLHSPGLSVLLHRELPQIPIPDPPVASPSPDQTYSNLLFTPLRKPVPDTVYECLAVGGEDALVPSVPTGTQLPPPRAGHGAADYACVRKVKKTVPGEVQDGAVAGPPRASQCWDGVGDAPRAKVRLWGGGRDGARVWWCAGWLGGAL